MYKVFICDKPLIFLDNPDQREQYPESIVLEAPDDKILSQYIAKFENNEIEKTIVIIAKNIESTFKKFSSLLIKIEAGGGLVTDKDGNYLFIFRRGCWDLPKGKTERGETIADAAIREVKEETGLDKISINKAIATTYHVYNEGDVRFLKKTYWFEMLSESDKEPVPQTSEDITHVKWLDKEMVTTNVFNNTYNSLRDFLKIYFS